MSEVQDGDSLTVPRNGSKESIRLAEVDAPELPQPYGSEARAYVTGLLMGQTVSVRPVTKDQYGRTVADIVMSDGQSLSRDLVEHGYAWLFIKYSSNPELAKLEREARAARRGLWKDPSPTAPWEFRDPQKVAAVNQNKPLAAAAIAPTTAAKKSSADQSETVYVTRTGAKYHRAGCRSLAKSQIPMPLSEAVKRYGPCSICRPPS